MPFWFQKELTGINPRTLGVLKSFTKSNGTTMARIYERLTRASRRSEKRELERLRGIGVNSGAMAPREERSYRKGVYDTLAALQSELRA